MAAETDEQRRKRERQRTLFDGVAGLYDDTRQGYPDEVTDAVLTTAGVGPDAAVLEIGCGTGQLTRQLAGRHFNLTAIDIGAALVSAARRNISDPKVKFRVSAFEDFTDSGTFDLIVSATAFHWVDPDVGLALAAQLLRPEGWLALLTTGERYPEPLRSALRELWMRYSHQTLEWTDRPAWAAALRETTLFGEVVEASHETGIRRPAETVAGVECTRATFLSFGENDKAGFARDLRRLLEPRPEVYLVQETFLAMAQVRS